MKKSIKEFAKLKYPKVYEGGIRRVVNRDGFTEVWSKGGDVIYFSATFMKEFEDYLNYNE